MPDIFLVKSNSLDGPFTPDEIKGLLITKEIESTQLAWIKGMESWGELNEKEFFELGIRISSKNPSRNTDFKNPDIGSCEKDSKGKPMLEIDESNGYGRALKKGIGCYTIFGVIFI